MSEKKINYLYEKVIKKFENTSIQIPKYFCKEIILSIRANLIREHMILMHKKILLLKTSIITDYENGMNILKLSTKYDGSPLNLLRLIFTHKYDNKLTELIKKKIC
jgi:hypothetical protein